MRTIVSSVSEQIPSEGGSGSHRLASFQIESRAVMELSPLLRECIDLAKEIATAVCKIVRASAGIPESGAPEEIDWAITQIDEAAFSRLKQAVADYARAAERLDDIDTSFLSHDIITARRKFNAPPANIFWGASHTGFHMGSYTKQVSAYQFVQSLVDMTETILKNHADFLFDEESLLAQVDPTKLAFFCGTMTAFGIPANYEIREVQQELEREGQAVQRLRRKYGSWNSISKSAEPVSDSVLSESEQTVLDYVRREPFCIAKEIASGTGLVQSSIERHFLPALRKRKLIRNKRGRGYYPA
jgi:hypothetical protein